jgi:DNA polymerase-3 subunit delta'
MFYFLKTQDNNIKYFLSLLNNNRLHSSIILSGQKGVGKEAFAKYIAKFLLSHNISDLQHIKDISIDPKVENLIIKNTHKNFMEITPQWDEVKKRYKEIIGVDEIRKIKDFLHLSKEQNQYKVVIINSLDMLNNNAANALLKTLEEPNKNTIFLLVCHNYKKLLDTIKSRCINLFFSGLSNEDMDFLLNKENLSITEYKKELFSMSAGSYEKLKWYLKEDNFHLYKMVTDALKNKKNIRIESLIKNIKVDDTTSMSEYYSMLLEFLESYLLNTSNENNLESNTALISEIHDFRNKIMGLNLDPISAISMLFYKTINT